MRAGPHRDHSFLERWSALFWTAHRDGRIRDGHGDLRTDTFISTGIQIIDCIEFNERFATGMFPWTWHSVHGHGYLGKA